MSYKNDDDGAANQKSVNESTGILALEDFRAEQQPDGDQNDPSKKRFAEEPFIHRASS